MRKYSFYFLSLLMVFFIFSSCDKEDDNETNVETEEKVYALGDIGPGGGKVFYDDQEGFDFNEDGNIGTDEKNLFNGKSGMDDKRYLEAAPLNWNSNEDPTAEWGDYGTDIANVVNLGVLTSEIMTVLPSMVGFGSSNTLGIVANMESKSIFNTAAQICNDYSGGDKNDWFLPSVGEMYMLYSRQYTVGGGFQQEEYWSSTEHSETLCWYVFMRSGSMGYNKKGVSNYNFRAIRAF